MISTFDSQCNSGEFSILVAVPRAALILVPKGCQIQIQPYNDFYFVLICHRSIKSRCNFDVKADTLALPWVIAGLQQEGVLTEQEVKKRTFNIYFFY